ncbi:isopeptide-forming domain-containing fimbrial protein, partial [Shouchella clausii]
MQSKKLLTRRRLLELRKLVIVTMVFLLSLSNFLPYSAQYAQANETPSLSDLELTQDVDGEERKEVEKGATFTFNVDALIPEDGSNEGTLTILNQVDKQLTIENVEVVVKEEEEAEEEESELEAVVEGQDVSLDLTPEQLDTVAGQHVTLKITAAFQDEVEAGTEIENVAEAFINGELAEKAEPVTVALLADAEATSEEETTEEETTEEETTEEEAQEEAQQEEEASTEEENVGEESSEEEQVSEEEQTSVEEQATEEEADGEEAAEETTGAEANNNEIIEKLDIDACGNRVALVNGEFDLPEGPGTYNNAVAGGGYYYADTVPGWETTDLARTPRGIIQIMDPARPGTIPTNAPNRENLTSRFAELNADTHSMLYQELPTIPGQTIYWRIDHRGYYGVDTMSVNIGPVTDDPFNTTPEIERFSTGTVWETYSGSYTVPEGQTVTRFGFKAISSSTGSLAHGNYIDNVFLGTEPCVDAEKSVSPEGEVGVGDELTYEVTVKNGGGDIAGNTVIEDAIPEGTEYVPGSMKIVNGPNAGDLTDENDEDGGHFDGDKIVINLGNLANTTELPDGITVQFKVKTLASHANDVVVNQANIGYKNLLLGEDETIDTNEVETPVVYLIPELESEKAATLIDKGEGNTDEDHVEVGDTLRYTIQARNIISGSIVEGMVISDTIPEGLEYVAGTLKVDGEAVTDDEDDDEGHYVDGGVVGNFGDVADADWHTLEFDVIVLPGQAGKDIENTALADGNNIDDPQEPSELVEVYPREGPAIEAEKTVSPEGEVFAGNILTYDVTIKNVGEHIAADAVFEDAIPEGTEYVPGSLKIVAGPNAGDLTDEEDSDAGHFDGEKVIVQLGNLETTTDLPDGVTVQFQVMTLESHVGETVVNQADIQYRNLQTDEEQSAQSNEVTNEIVETPDIDACAQPVALVNGSFEEPPARMPGETGSPGSEQFWQYFHEDEVPGWKTNASDKFIQIMKTEANYYNRGIIPPHGNQYAELNAHQVSALYQDVETTPGQTIYWRLAHRGLLGVDTMAVQIGSADIPADDLPVIEQISTGNTGWVYYSGSYTVPAGQTVTRFAFNSVDAAGGSQQLGNLLDDIFLGTEPCVVAEKSVSPEGEVNIGDELTYEVTIKNNGGDIADDVFFEDAIPEGTEYVPGSIKILTGPNAGDLTDADDNDAGQFDGEKVIIELGELQNATELPDGITVQFKVKTLASHANDVVVNKANVRYKDLLADEEKSTDTNEVETPIVYQKPVIESEKNATLLEKAEGNTDADNPEVGDTLLYKIQGRNTLEGSIVENFVIFDVIPEGLEYVPGTLKVNGEAVTDDEDDDDGHYVDGEVFGSFGDVTDTEWHTLEFQVIVGEGQAGKDIKNTAVVDGDNLDDPDE